MVAPNQIISLGPLSTSYQQLAFLLCLLSSYPLAFLYHRNMLHSRWLKLKHFCLYAPTHIFILACYSIPVLANLYVPVLTTFAMCRRWRDRRWMPVAVFAALLAHLASAHLYRQFFEDPAFASDIDQTAPLMCLTIKLTSYAFDISDAYFAAVWERPRRSNRTRRLSSSPAPHSSPSTSHNIPSSPTTIPPSSPSTPSSQAKRPTAEEIYRERQLISLQRPASLPEFLGYTFLFPGFLTGPTISFYEYRCFVDGSYFQGVDKTATSADMKGRRRRALRQFLLAMFFLAFFVSFKDSLTLRISMSPEHVSEPLWYRILFLHAVNLVWRAKYYFAWIIAEGAYVMIGLGFRRPSHPSGKPHWDRCQNVDLKRIELASNFKQIVSEWNVCTNQWLYTYVYKRVADWLYPSGKPGFRANLITYVVSSVWHVLIRVIKIYSRMFRDSTRDTIFSLSALPFTLTSPEVHTSI